MEPKPQFEMIAFKTPKEFGAWLKKHHAKSDGIWLRFYKKASGVKTVTYAQALDEALCFGWIDSQAKTLDEQSYVQKFTPRRSKSIWSKRNRDHIARLTKEGRMAAAGLKQVDEAKEDGRWDAAYDSPKNMTIPADFLRVLKKDKKAHGFFKTLSKANAYAIAWRLQTAKKEETRQRRASQILEMLKRGEKFH